MRKGAFAIASGALINVAVYAKFQVYIEYVIHPLIRYR